MKKYAFTLVELIFSIVIIAIVFTVVPKLMFATTKTMEVSIKEDGLFAGIALMGNIIRLPWDANTVVSEGKILDTAANTCNERRLGGFLGSRNCVDSNDLATLKANFGTAGDYGDVDDYDNYSAVTASGRVPYTLGAGVNYTDTNLNSSVGTNELKEVNVSVSSAGKTNLCTSFFYYSANLGHIQINKRAW